MREWAFRAVSKDTLGAESAWGPFWDGLIHFSWGPKGGARGGSTVLLSVCPSRSPTLILLQLVVCTLASLKVSLPPSLFQGLPGCVCHPPSVAGDMDDACQSPLSSSHQGSKSRTHTPADRAPSHHQMPADHPDPRLLLLWRPREEGLPP